MKIQYQADGLVVFESVICRTTTTLIYDSDYLLLIDPNWLPQEVAYIANWVAGMAAGKKQYLLFTHSDYDHIIGYHCFPDFTTIASRNFIEHQEQATILDQIRSFDDQYYLKRDYEIAYPTIDLPIEGDGVNIQLGKDQYLFYQARGHNQDGILIYNQTKKWLIVGDYLSNIEFPFIYDSFAHYHQTLDKLASILAANRVQLLVPGHGDITTNDAVMQERVIESRDYLLALEDLVINEKSFDLSSLLSKYDFHSFLTKMHQANIELLYKERGLAAIVD